MNEILTLLVWLIDYEGQGFFLELIGLIEAAANRGYKAGGSAPTKGRDTTIVALSTAIAITLHCMFKVFQVSSYQELLKLVI
jgi:hypothetical protein